MAACRIRLSFLLVFLVLMHLSPVYGAAKQPADDLEALVAMALANNPEVKASAERWQMSVERVRQAGVLEDPMLMLRVQNLFVNAPFDFQRDTTTAKVIGLSQKIPFYGKRDLMREEARFDAEAERWVVEERKVELRRMVKEAWFQIGLIDRSLETIAGNIVLLDDMIRLAESMYSVGKTGQQEIFQAQLERSKMEEMRLTFEQKRRSLGGILNSLAYRPTETVIPPMTNVTLPSPALAAAELETLAMTHRPAVKSLQAKIDKTGASAKLADKDFYPDFTVSLEYMQREPVMESAGDPMYAAQLSFNLPIQTERRHARVAEVEAERRMATQELAALRNRIKQAINDYLAQLERGRKVVQLYDKGMLIQAEGTVEATMAAYRTGKAKFAEVLASRNALFTLQREYHGAVADYQMQLAALESVVGAPLPTTLQPAADQRHTPSPSPRKEQ